MWMHVCLRVTVYTCRGQMITWIFAVSGVVRSAFRPSHIAAASVALSNFTWCT